MHSAAMHAIASICVSGTLASAQHPAQITLLSAMCVKNKHEKYFCSSSVATKTFLHQNVFYKIFCLNVFKEYEKVSQDLIPHFNCVTLTPQFKGGMS